MANVFHKAKRMRFPSYTQHDQMDCGPARLKIIAKHYGKKFSMKYLRDKCYITREGVSLFDIARHPKILVSERSL
ncbi:cysteine peptidase family C39 domain-containing protein [Parapedobacter sp. 10938]|uniref:cysteine peptidase family C39 domain-containing protein n=1 Tax=Parapedobacter flavus TaxID=3110225 RepID=UPI002DB95892|nr:cysteine peptidase family C39 domain-containing protein [Parapedobacter sp. 10938]MEC3879734.1 cysteine peptidase family C39 domain-containing protein [Parapedobacter sp. 10938]